MAVVLVVVSLVLGSLLVPLASQVEQRRIESTEQILEQARDAVLAFAAVHRRLPCPADATGGQEKITMATGVCSYNPGFLPAATLGLSPLDAEGFVRDGWGMEQNRVRYAVSDLTVSDDGASPQAFVVTKLDGIKTAFDAIKAVIKPKMSAFNVCNTGACSGSKLTGEALAVIWSVGPNAATTGGLSDDEKQNPNPNPDSSDPTAGIFVSRPRGAGAGPEFDDQMVWITPPLLFQRMIAAGQLP
jgi:type II secretory pathway pseudopilin PulG